MPEEKEVPESGATGAQVPASPPPEEGAESQEQEAESSAETQKTEQSAEQEGQEKEAEVPDEQLPFHKHPRWQQRQKELEDLRAEKQKLQEENEQTRKVSEFYATQFNERYGAEAAARPVVPGKPAAPKTEESKPDELPQGVLPPDQWKSQADIGPYVDHLVQIKVAKEAEKLNPVFDRINRTFAAHEEEALKSSFKDYDAVIKSALPHIFTLDPAGNILGVKDQATLNWINSHQMPRKALYDFGKSKTSKQTIQQTVAQTTQKLVEDLNKKPNVTRPPSSGRATTKESGVPDWDADKGQVDKYLTDKGAL
jgi:hypothetical protein